MPAFRASSLIRVSGRFLDIHKQWYLLTKEICGTRPADFVKTELFTKIFPDEIEKIEWREVQPVKSYSTSNARLPPSFSYFFVWPVCWTSAPKGNSPYGLIKLPTFMTIRRLANTLPLNEEPQDISNSGRESQQQCKPF